LISTKRITEKSKKKILFLQLIECVIFATPTNIYIYIYKKKVTLKMTPKKKSVTVYKGTVAKHPPRKKCSTLMMI
jgi:hypothetical protein